MLVTLELTEFSTLHFSQVLDGLKDGGAMMSAVVLVNPRGSNQTDAARNRAVVLDRGIRDSGGTRVDVLTSLSFGNALSQIAAALKHQHRVVYARPAAADSARANRSQRRQERRRWSPAPRRADRRSASAPLVVLGSSRFSRPGDALAAQQPTPPAPPPQVFRSGVDIVSLNVTVTDTQNRYLTDLEQTDFTVLEDGARQELLYFSKSNLPIALSLLIDTSASMEERLLVAQNAAVGFAQRIREQDLAQVIDFDSRVEIVQEFTADKAALERAIRSTSSGGSTSLYNAIYIALRELKKVRTTKQDEVLRRDAIILLSDGEDTTSLVSFEEVMELAKRSETSIYTIGLQPREPAYVKGFREAEFVLRQLAQETGGRAFFVQKAEELIGVYGQIADELSSQYSLGYASKNAKRDGAWRKLSVQVARPSAVTRTRRGYYGPSR